MRGTVPLSQAATSLHLGDVLQRVNNLTVQQWRPEDFSKVRVARSIGPDSGLGDVGFPYFHLRHAGARACVLQNLQALVAETPHQAPVLQFLRMLPATSEEPTPVEIAEWTRQSRCVRARHQPAPETSVLKVVNCCACGAMHAHPLPFRLPCCA